MKMNLNQIYIPHKSNTCFSKTGNPLSAYNSLAEAQRSANYQSSENKFTPYYCNTCGKYHLKPTEYFCKKKNSTCDCRDHQGNKKDTYETRYDAEKMVKIRGQAGITLYVYECPQGNGFHLTSSKGW